MKYFIKFGLEEGKYFPNDENPSKQDNHLIKKYNPFNGMLICNGRVLEFILLMKVKIYSLEFIFFEVLKKLKSFFSFWTSDTFDVLGNHIRSRQHKVPLCSLILSHFIGIIVC